MLIHLNVTSRRLRGFNIVQRHLVKALCHYDIIDMC